MNIVILNSSNDPIYIQIKNQIKTQIINNSLKAGEYLPSIRQLAAELKISVITTTKAYGELEKEGFIVSVVGKGFYVNAIDSGLIKEQIIRSIEERFMEVIDLAETAALNKNELLEVFDNIYGEKYE